MAKLIHQKTNQVLAQKVIKSRFILSRIKGLIGIKNFTKDKTLWILPCSSIHTFFMSFPIDVIFVNKKLKITTVLKNIPHSRLIYPKQYFSTQSVFEFKSPALKHFNLQTGDQLYVEY